MLPIALGQEMKCGKPRLITRVHAILNKFILSKIHEHTPSFLCLEAMWTTVDYIKWQFSELNN